jgi:L-amino acid N-acyltransferase YncA
MIKHVEDLARERGATVLRSGTGIENTASRELHAKLGFQTCHMDFEKEI